MSWPATLVLSLLTGLLALATAGVVADAFAGWYRWSSFEGAAGYAVVGVALLGGIAGLVLGGIVARTLPAGLPTPFLRGLAISCAVVLGLAASAAAVGRLLADVPAAPEPSEGEARPSRAKLEAERVAEAEARFAAMDPDAPLVEWIAWTRFGVTPLQRAAAVSRIAAREDLADELGALALSDDTRRAEEALRLVELVPSESLIPPVAEAGRDIAARIRAIAAGTPVVVADADLAGTPDVAVRFAGWMVAARTLRAQAGADLTPELGEILELARTLPDDPLMRSDVVRIASYYLHEWAGVAPLPTDPPPR